MRIDLHSAFAAVNESLANLYDALGVRRAFTLPFVQGHDMSQHIQAVQQISQQHGGITENLLSTYHHAGKGGWNSAAGETVGHPVENLQTTLIPKDFPEAIKVIAATRTLITKAATLIGDKDPAIVQARSQLGLLNRSNAAQMNLFDFGSMIQFIAQPVLQSVAKAHHAVKTKAAGMHQFHPLPLPPRHGMPQPSEEEDGEEQQGETSEENSSTSSQAATAPKSAGQVISVLRNKQGK